MDERNAAVKLILVPVEVDLSRPPTSEICNPVLRVINHSPEPFYHVGGVQYAAEFLKTTTEPICGQASDGSIAELWIDEDSNVRATASSLENFLLKRHARGVPSNLEKWAPS